MMNLRIVLWAKITITVGLLSFPMLTFPANFIETLGFPVSESIIFIRLLGMAYTALAVCYVFGVLKIKEQYPEDVVWVGIVSNGGASLMLLIAALLGSWSEWNTFAKVYMWASLVCITLITLGLIVTGPLRKSSQ